MILIDENVIESPVVKLGNSTKSSVLIEILLGGSSDHTEVWWEFAEKLLNLGKMVVILVEVGTLSWLEKEVTSKHLENHTGKRPVISVSFIFNSDDCFWGSVLSSLDLMSEVMMSPTSVTKIGDFDSDVFIDWRSSTGKIIEGMLLFLFFLSLFAINKLLVINIFSKDVTLLSNQLSWLFIVLVLYVLLIFLSLLLLLL